VGDGHAGDEVGAVACSHYLCDLVGVPCSPQLTEEGPGSVKMEEGAQLGGLVWDRWGK
jgi:hypothetical protein